MDENIARNKNIGDIYRLIYHSRQISRQEISKILNISLPTTTQNLNTLQNLGLIRKDGEFRSTGGRKPSIYCCVSDARYAIGINVTKHHLSIVLIDLDLNMIDSRRMRISFEENDSYFSILRQQILDIISQNISDSSKLLGIGISLPALLGQDHKTVNYATVIPLSSNIYSVLKNYIDLPFLFFNDSNSAGLAESWKGNYTNSVIYLSLSGSIGGANMNGKTLYTGDNNRSSEFGHMTVVPHGKRCYCGRYGCLDAYCSSNVLSDFTDGNLKEFFERLDSSQGFRNVFDDYMDHLAIAVNNLRMCFDCDIILGGNVGAYISDYIDEFRQKALALNPFENDGSFIRPCHYPTEAAAVGAAIYYIDSFIQNFGV